MLINGLLRGVSSYNATRKEKEHIIQLFWQAIRLTKHHINNSRTQEGEDQVSVELYKTWMAVSNSIKPYDRENSKLFEEKAEYWLEPGTWSEELRRLDDEYGIKMQLSNVESQYWTIKTIWEIE